MDMLKCLNIVRFGFTIKVFLTALPMQKLRRNQRFLLPSFWVCYCLTDFVHTKTVTHLGFDDKRWTFVSPIATDHPRTNQSVRAKTPSLLDNFIKVLQINILCIKMQLNSLRFGSALFAHIKGTKLTFNRACMCRGGYWTLTATSGHKLWRH